MRAFQKGEKAKLADLTPSSDLSVGVAVTGSGVETYDVSCFGVDAADKLSDERYFVFYNQKESPEGALAALGASGGDHEVFRVEIARLPSTIRKLVFTVTLDGTGSMSSLREGHLRLMAGGNEVARFGFTGKDFAAERAVIVGEIYLKDVWRFAAVGQGFNGGLSALLAHFGGEEIGPTSPPPAPPATIPTRNVPPPVASPTPGPSTVRLSKVTLDKKGDKKVVDLRKGGGDQPFHFNLNWDQHASGGAPKKKGFLAGLSGGGAAGEAPDLDLGCMYKMADGTAGCIQPLGGNFGNRSAAPFIYLDKDDRSGAAADGENLYIYRPDLVDQVMVFALIYQGATDFTSVNARLTIKDQQGNEILVQLNNPDRNLRFCTIAMIAKTSSGLEIRKEERYFKSHAEADTAFGFGFNWRAGRK